MRKKSMKVYLIYLKSLSFEKIWRRFASSHLFIFKNQIKKKKKKKMLEYSKTKKKVLGL